MRRFDRTGGARRHPGRLGTTLRSTLAALAVSALLIAGTLGGCGQNAVVAPPGYVDVRLFGANPDDAVSDSAAIQAAIDAAGNQGRVIFPPQKPGGAGYIITDPDGDGVGICSARDGQVWDAKGARFSVRFNGVAVRMGSSPVITTISGNGTTITVNTATPHYFKVGDGITVADVTGYAGSLGNARVASIVDADTFTITDSDSGSGTGGRVIKTTDTQDVALGQIMYWYNDGAIPTPFNDTLSPYPVNSSNPDGWTSGNVGLQLLNTHSAQYRFESIAGFDKGCYPLSQDADSHHCEVKVGRIRSCRWGLYIRAQGTTNRPASLNAWTFSGPGRIGYTDSDPSGGEYAIELSRSASPTSSALYGHVFTGLYLETPAIPVGVGDRNIKGLLKPNCVGCDFTGINFEPVPTVGTTVRMIDARSSEIGTPYDFPNSQQPNIFRGGAGLINRSKIETTATTDAVFELQGSNEAYIGHSTSVSTLHLKNLNAFYYPVLTTGSGATDYAGSISAAGVVKVGSLAKSFGPASGNPPDVTTPGQIFWDTSSGWLSVSDGARNMPVNGVVFTQASSGTSNAANGVEGSIVSATNAMGSKTLAANTFVLGRVLRVKAHGYLTADEDVNVVFRIKAGSTAICESDDIAVANTTTASWIWFLESETKCHAVGASGTVHSLGRITFCNLADGTTHTASTNQTYAMLHPSGEGSIGNVITIDTTASQLIDIVTVMSNDGDTGTNSLVVVGFSSSYEILR